jgi:hypothetical protein
MQKGVRHFASGLSALRNTGEPALCKPAKLKPELEFHGSLTRNKLARTQIKVNNIIVLVRARWQISSGAHFSVPEDSWRVCLGQ